MFGMGTGIASPLWPPAFITNLLQRKLLDEQVVHSFQERYLRSFAIVDEDENMVKPHDLLVLLG